MDKEYIILLKDFKFGRCGLVNQFLIDNELESDLRVVIAEYERPVNFAYEAAGEHMTTERCIGLEVVNEKRAFYYQLKGHNELEKKIKEYEAIHR